MKQKNIPSIGEILNKKFTTFQTQVTTNIQNLNNDLKTTLNQELDNRVGMINERVNTLWKIRLMHLWKSKTRINKIN